jgi:hypothetical protein
MLHAHVVCVRMLAPSILFEFLQACTGGYTPAHHFQGWPEPHIHVLNGIFGREITKYTVICCVCIQFLPTLSMFVTNRSRHTLTCAHA